MFTPKPAKKKLPSEPFKNMPAGLRPRSIVDFWSWAYSDLLQNTTRGVLAEYLVAALLDIDNVPRMPWDAYDLKMQNGTTIEIKTMSQLQGWVQRKLSTPRITLSPTRAWDPLTGKMELEPTFNADFYIFCYFHADSHDTADAVDLSQWTFYLLPQATLIKSLRGRKSISLKDLSADHIDELSAGQLVTALKNP